jgi:hypothetical protein
MGRAGGEGCRGAGHPNGMGRVRLRRAFFDAAKPLVLDTLGRPAGSRPGYVIPAEELRHDALDPTGERSLRASRLLDPATVPNDAWRRSACDACTADR